VSSPTLDTGSQTYCASSRTTRNQHTLCSGLATSHAAVIPFFRFTPFFGLPNVLPCSSISMIESSSSSHVLLLHCRENSVASVENVVMTASKSARNKGSGRRELPW
jgi:hypothetical protein